MDFKLDVAKWRCGGGDSFALGEGCTSLLNKQGYMCCLGQFSKQCMGVTDDQILRKIDPESLYTMFDEDRASEPEQFILVDKEASNHYYHPNSELSKKALKINDNPSITTDMRIRLLKELFEQYGHTITVINLPEDNT